MTLAGHRAVRTRAIVIGGGVVGCAVLHSLAAHGVDAILVEAAPDICEGSSKANSAIVHTGFDATAGTVEARLLRRSADLWPDLLTELSVPYLAVGALMVARTRQEEERLRTGYAAKAAALGVETEMLDAATLRAMAPYITTEAVAALHIPGEAVIDPFWLTRAYAASAMAQGAEVWTDARLTAIRVDAGAIELDLADGRSLAAEQAFDCAGLWADEVAALAGDRSFSLTPRKGQFLVSEDTAGVDRIVLPIPGPMGKGMLVTPIVFGGVLLGPTAEDGHDKGDRSTDAAGQRAILDACRALVPDVGRMDPVRRFAGVRAVSSTGDYVLRPSTAGDRLYLVAGIRSTGISASPAIAEAAVGDAIARRGWAVQRGRPTPVPEAMWADEAGAVVCPCRSVAEAEVQAALDAAPRPVTVDGVKRRCGVGFGDCQGNQCQVEVIERLAVACDRPPEAILRGGPGSWIVAGMTAGTVTGTGTETGRADPWSIASAAMHPAWVDLVIVGGGLAGIGAALAADDAGLRVSLIDRGKTPGGGIAAVFGDVATEVEVAAHTELRDRVARGRIGWIGGATVSDLGALDGGGWEVRANSHLGSLSPRAGQVVLATGGYVMPREHLAIDGPRPSGVMTADFALAALRKGWLPGRKAVVVGDGRLAAATASSLAGVGVEIAARVRTGVAPHDGRSIPDPTSGVDGVRGNDRLEAVRISGAWVPADTLVLAHALRPATFLLRGLGIGDDRPGIPAPAQPDGRLPLPDLWACGTCVHPDVDHARSLAAGRAVGRAAAAAAGGVAAVEPGR